MNIQDLKEINIENDINIEESLNKIKQIISLEKQKKEFHFINIKNLSLQNKIQIFKYFLSDENIENPIIILNIINLLKIYNNMSDEFFNNKYIYINNLEQFLDLKLQLHKEIKQINKKISIIFLSLLKSYNKFTFTPLDNYVEISLLYKHIFLTMDLLTISGIFSITQNINTNQLFYIKDAYVYIQHVFTKNNIFKNMLYDFFKDKINE